VERRTQAKENAKQQRMRRAQNRQCVKQALDRVRNAARQREEQRFTTLFHCLTIDMLRLSFLALKRDAAAGVDGVKWKEYESDLEHRLTDLHARVYRGAYHTDQIAPVTALRAMPGASQKNRPAFGRAARS